MAAPLQKALLAKRLGTLVEVVHFGAAPAAAQVFAAGWSGGSSSGSSQEVTLAVTLFACGANASVASPDCEAQVSSDKRSYAERGYEWAWMPLENIFASSCCKLWGQKCNTCLCGLFPTLILP